METGEDESHRVTQDRRPVLYWESHVTVEPCFGEKLHDLRELCRRYNFRVAELLFQKERAATAIRSNLDSFCTSRGPNFDELKTRMEACIAAFQSHGYKVWRKKIEAAILDERL
jgi:hypothetical protein